MINIDPEFVEIVNDNFWELIDMSHVKQNSIKMKRFAGKMNRS